MTIANDRTATVGTPTGSASVITPYKPSASTAYYEAIVPCGQQKPAAFISVTMNGQTFTINPDAPADAANFLENKKYAYTLTLSRTGITVTSNITDWTPVAGTAATSVSPINIRMNPLWYVAETNVDYTAADGTKTWDDGKGTFSFASEFNGGYFFDWDDALTYFSSSSNASTDTPTSISEYYNSNNLYLPGWHLPTQNEWNSIIPGSESNNTPRVNIMNIVESNGGGAIYSKECNLCFGFNDETKGVNGGYMNESSYWYRYSDYVVYAIRYCNTDFCSAWKYVWTAGTASNDNPGYFTVSCTLINKITVEQAQTLYGTTESNWTNIYFGNDESVGAVQRVFAALGGTESITSTNPVATTSQGEYCQYWSTTENDETYAWNMGGDGVLSSGIKRRSEPAHQGFLPLARTPDLPHGGSQGVPCMDFQKRDESPSDGRNYPLRL